MPVGNPKNQTIWSQRYQEKVGYITKGYKLKKDLTDNFKEACSKSGISQAAALTQFMEVFIDASKNKASANSDSSSTPEYMINSEDPKLSFIIETYDNLSDNHKDSIYKYVKKYYSKKNKVSVMINNHSLTLHFPFKLRHSDILFDYYNA